ncbi:MAG: hypothetical protein M3Y87_34355 [Myxococcota bacterium]|nr:hypothetical protein [Myxococcota bacterium]
MTYRTEGSDLWIRDAEGETHVTFCVQDGFLTYHHEGERVPYVLRRSM